MTNLWQILQSWDLNDLIKPYLSHNLDYMLEFIVIPVIVTNKSMFGHKQLCLAILGFKYRSKTRKIYQNNENYGSRMTCLWRI